MCQEEYFDNVAWDIIPNSGDITWKRLNMTFSFQSFCRCNRWCNEQRRKTSSCPQSWCLSWSSGTSLSPCHWMSIHMLSCVEIKAVTNSTTLLESEEIWPATLVEIIWVSSMWCCCCWWWWCWWWPVWASCRGWGAPRSPPRPGSHCAPLPRSWCGPGWGSPE